MTSWGDYEAELRNWLVDYLVTNIGCSPDQIDLDAPLNELGVGSRDAVVLSGELSELLRRPVSPVDFWQNPTINALAHALVHPDAGASSRLMPGTAGGSLNEPIAVIGLGCRLPGDIHGPDALWDFLAAGRSAVSTVPDERWQAFDDGSPEAAAALAHTTRWGSFLSDIAGFDAEFFGITPREADRIDPQQRLLLEVAVEALEHAGIPAESLQRSQTGVFAGACVSEYGYLASRDLGQIDAWTGTGGALEHHRQSALLLPRPAGTVAHRGHRLLVVAGRGAPGLPEPADRPIRAGDRRRGEPGALACGDTQLRCRRSDVANRRLPCLRRRRRRIRPR